MKNYERLRIGIIDSGINISSTKIDWKRIKLVESFYFKDFNDETGHGTAISYIIQERTPNDELYIIKVLGEQNSGKVEFIIDAIEWCINNNIDIINLSVAIYDFKYYYLLKQICNKAFSKGCIIVASTDNLGRISLPAYLDSVIGVGQLISENDDFIFLPHKQVKLYVKSNKIKTIDLKDNFITVNGASYATAIATSIIAKFKKEVSNYDELTNLLTCNSSLFKKEKILIENRYFNSNSKTKQISLDLSYIFPKLQLSELMETPKLEVCFLTQDILEDCIVRELNNNKRCLLIAFDKIEYIENQKYLESQKTFLNSSFSIIGKVTNDVIRILKKSTDKNLFIYSSSYQERQKRFEYIITKLKRINFNHIFRNEIPCLVILDFLFSEFLGIEFQIILNDFLKQKFKVANFLYSRLGVIFDSDFFVYYYDILSKLTPFQMYLFLNLIKEKLYEKNYNLIVFSLNSKPSLEFNFKSIVCKSVNENLLSLLSPKFVLIPIDVTIEFSSIDRWISFFTLNKTEVFLLDFSTHPYIQDLLKIKKKDIIFETTDKKLFFKKVENKYKIPVYNWKELKEILIKVGL
ncbi:MAG: S8 family serine peptidase [Brevinematia bacterium]